MCPSLIVSSNQINVTIGFLGSRPAAVVGTGAVRRLHALILQARRRANSLDRGNAVDAQVVRSEGCGPSVP